MQVHHTAVAILPSTDLDRSESFYNRLGFSSAEGERPEWFSHYRILHDASGASLHLNLMDENFFTPKHNPAALYLYTEDVDRLAAAFGQEILEASKRAENKPWGMYEFALSDPDGALVRIGWPDLLRHSQNVEEQL